MARRRKRPVPTLAVVAGRRLTPGQAAVLRAASKAEAEGHAGEARRLLSGLEADLDALADEAWLTAALAETAALEQARGGRLERTGASVRVSGRDGLRGLFERGGLTKPQYAAGMDYRAHFEAAAATLRSTLDVRPGRAPARSPDGAMDRLRHARQAVFEAERRVQAACVKKGAPALAADALMVLREVAGLGRSLRALATSGTRREALKSILGDALDAAAGVRARSG